MTCRATHRTVTAICTAFLGNIAQIPRHSGHPANAAEQQPQDSRASAGTRNTSPTANRDHNIIPHNIAQIPRQIRHPADTTQQQSPDRRTSANHRNTGPATYPQPRTISHNPAIYHYNPHSLRPLPNSNWRISIHQRIPETSPRQQTAAGTPHRTT